jgi:hypothetical protein
MPDCHLKPLMRSFIICEESEVQSLNHSCLFIILRKGMGIEMKLNEEGRKFKIFLIK